tara:strand:+ start:1756 stop:2490 length:735 start_codon:yes stop_codon:yes gene_type:complete
MYKIDKLLKIPQYEQRSDMWFKQRENKLTSSDAGTVLNLNPYQKPHEVLFKKCGHDLKPFVGNIATKHGQMYEDEAIEKYCRLTGQVNYNFGLISHEDVYNTDEYYWMAGSPDGICISKDNLESEPVLLEVKCPYRRKIKIGKIPEYYIPQVQLNLFICNLNVADFIEYIPPKTMNIVRVYKDQQWLDKNVPILEAFWKEVEFYRNNDIKNHPKFPVEKKILDLRSNENENENEDIVLDYCIRD